MSYSWEEFFNSQEVKLQLGPGLRLFVHDPEVVYWVEFGRVDLYSLDEQDIESDAYDIIESMAANHIPHSGEVIQGKLIFLSALAPNTLIFSFPLSAEFQKIFIKANSPAIIRITPLSKLQAFLKETPAYANRFARACDSWAEMAFSYFHVWKRPQLEPVYLNIEKTISVNKGDVITLAADEHLVNWVKSKSGAYMIQGVPIADIDPSSPNYPITFRDWIVVDEPGEIASHKSSNLSFEELYQGISNYNRVILMFLDYAKLIEEKEHWKSLVQNINLDNDLMKQSLQQVESLLVEQQSIKPLLLGKKKLLRVLEIIGHTLNQQVINWQDFKSENPIEQAIEIASLSRIGARRISFNDEWLQSFHVPLLGIENREEPEPIAFIPGPKQKTLAVHADSKERPAGEEDLKNLRHEGVAFYRTFEQSEGLSWWKVFLFAMKNQYREAVRLILSGILSVATIAFFYFAMELIIDDILPYHDLRSFLEIGIGLLIAIIASTFFLYLRESILQRFEGIAENDVQSAFWLKLINMPLRFYREFNAGNLIDRVSAPSLIRRFFSGTTGLNLFSGIFSLTVIPVIIYLSPALSVATLVFALVILIAGFFIVYHIYAFDIHIQDRKGKSMGGIVQYILGIPKIKTTATENRFFAVWCKNITLIKKAELSSGRLKNILFILRDIMPLLYSFVLVSYIMIYSGDSSPSSILTVGYFLAFYIASLYFITYVMDFIQTAAQSVDAAIYAKRAKPLLVQPTEHTPRKLTIQAFDGNIQADNLHVRFDMQGAYILEGVSFQAHKGEFIGIAGKSGSGKSTLIRVLLGMEQIEKGGIFYDGVDIGNLDLLQLRRQIGVVSQTSVIFKGTVRDNINFNATYSDDEIRDVIQMVNMHEELDRLPLGLDTMLTTGGQTLSSGQRQRILIARALISKPKVLIIDEAMNAIDDVTNRSILNKLEKIGTTRILVTYHFHLLTQTNRIYYLDKGKLLGAGTLDELMKNKQFKQLIERNF